MFIALVILHADIAKGGAERYTVDLANQLLGRGHEVTLAASTFGGGIDEGVNRVTLPATGATRRGRYLTFVDFLDMHLDKTDYHIVHAMLPVYWCDVYHPHAGLAAEAVAAGHRKHDSGVARGAGWVANRLNFKRRAFWKIEQHLLESPAPPVVISLSNYIQKTIRTHYPHLPEDKLATLFNAVDLQRFDPERDPLMREQMREKLGFKSDDVIALFIGQDFVRKGLPQAIAAVRALNDPRLKLLVVGGSPQPAAGPVVYAGSTPDPRPYYAAADCFILPTRHDPCSLVVLEALAMGLPVISTRFNGACEIMSPEHGFVLNEAGDVNALADAMRRLLDPVIRRAMSAACLSLRPRLSQDNHLEKLEAIYRSRIPTG